MLLNRKLMRISILDWLCFLHIINSYNVSINRKSRKHLRRSRSDSPDKNSRMAESLALPSMLLPAVQCQRPDFLIFPAPFRLPTPLSSIAHRVMSIALETTMLRGPGAGVSGDSALRSFSPEQFAHAHRQPLFSILSLSKLY